MRWIDKKDVIGELEYSCGGDGMTMELDYWGGLHVGDILPSGAEVLAIFMHPESGSAWCIIKVGERYADVTLEYNDGEGGID